MFASSLEQELIISELTRINERAEIRNIFFRERFIAEVFYFQNIQITGHNVDEKVNPMVGRKETKDGGYSRERRDERLEK